MKRLLPALAALTILLSGCKKDIQTKEAVLQGLINHLSKRSDLSISSMKVEITAVTFKGNEADATVAFAPKGMDAASGMTMRYTLEKKGNEWVVKTKADSGMGGTAGGMGGHGAPPASATPPSGMPADHPPIGSMGGAGTKK